MTGVAEHLHHPSRLRLAWDALRGRRRWEALVGSDDSQAANEDEGDASVAFAELVWAHNERQRELKPGKPPGGEWEKVYRQRLKRFKAEHGEIIDSYWCRYEASGVALTEKERPRRLRNFYRRDPVLRLHTATDWRTSTAPTVASALHQWHTAAIKASEVLRDASERIALHWMLAGSTRLLAAVDRPPRTSAGNGSAPQVDKEQESALAKVVKEQDAALTNVAEFYRRAGENSARIVYFKGMAWGTFVLAAVVGGAFVIGWSLGWLDPHEPRVYTLFVTIAMGAAGAILSVMTRMARRDGFSLEFEVGRKSMRFLGGLRPWIGAMFALALYVALKSNLLELLQGQKHGIYFYSTIAFASGFSERRAKVLLDGMLDGGSGSDDKDETGAEGTTKKKKKV